MVGGGHLSDDASRVPADSAIGKARGGEPDRPSRNTPSSTASGAANVRTSVRPCRDQFGSSLPSANHSVRGVPHVTQVTSTARSPEAGAR